LPTEKEGKVLIYTFNKTSPSPIFHWTQAAPTMQV